MKIFNLFLPITTMIFAGIFTGCTVASHPADLTKDSLKDLKKLEDLNTSPEIPELPKLELIFRLKNGGQPGLIRVGGIIVKDDAQTDIRISIKATPGLDAEKNQTALSKDAAPVLTSKIADTERINAHSKENTLMSLGCDKAVTDQYAQENNLEVKKIEYSDKNPKFLSLEANTVILCKDLDKAKLLILGVEADHLILDNVDYTQAGELGMISLESNKLTLNGANAISTISGESVLSASNITLQVVKEISSDEEGSLALISIGSNYQEEKK